MKAKVLFSGMFLLFAANIFSQTAPAVTDKTAPRKENTMRASDKWSMDKIQDFINKATSGGLMEVELGKEAERKGVSQSVKDFGKLMVKDHTDANQKLKDAVQKQKLSFPDAMEKKSQDRMDKLNDKTGSDFDKDYVDMMVKDHKDDVADFEKAQTNLPAGPVKDWVDKSLPVLRSHLDKIKIIQAQMDKNK